MRVTPRARTRRHTEERGAVAVMVAIVLVLIMAMAAFALDTGDGWQSRRHLIVATDAAALAAAETYAENGDGCADVPQTFVSANLPGAIVTSCDYTSVGPGAGYVTVQAKFNVDYSFAGIMGFDDRDVHSSTTAAFGLAEALSGLRPLALCSATSAFESWLASGKVTPFTIRITYAKESPDDCGANVPGNWGVLDYDGGANSNDDTMNWVENGYPEPVDIPSVQDGDTGAFSPSLNVALETLKTSGAVFQVPIYDSAEGNGANSQFNVTNYVSVVLIDYKTTGPEEGRWLEIEFRSDVAQGTCCAQIPDTGTRVVFICAVDAVFPASNCTDRL
jgi:Flp pilus assembly protein TadG